MDNIFVIAMVFTCLGIPAVAQHRAAIYGILVSFRRTPAATGRAREHLT